MKVCFFALFLLVASASASLFSGGDVKPNANPIVDKYYEEKLEEKLVIYIVTGILGAIILFILSALYYTFRFCRSCWCCCIKACRVDKHKRRDSLDDEVRIQKSSQALSMILRISLSVLYLLIVGLIIIGLIASTEVHKNIVETTKSLDTSISSINETAYKANYTFSHLRSINITSKLQTDFTDLTNSTNTLAEDAHTLHEKGPRIDGIRNKATMAVYIFTFIPLLLGIVGVILAKGRLTFIMTLLIPLVAMSCWILFAFHYGMFIVNVDVCHVIDQAYVNSTTPSPSTTSSLYSPFDCSTYSSAAAPLMAELQILTNETMIALSKANDTTTKTELSNQLLDLHSVAEEVMDWENCTALTNILTVAYPDICGKAVEASLFLWRSQIGLTVVLIVTFIIALIAETKIVPRMGKKKGDYSTLALLN